MASEPSTADVGVYELFVEGKHRSLKDILQRGRSDAFLDIDRRTEVYFDREKHVQPLPPELRNLSTGWYRIRQVHLSSGNASYDLEVTLPDSAPSILDHAGYWWFERIRWVDDET